MTRRKTPEQRKNKLIESEANPNAAGRPITFKPEYCEMLIDHMKEGLSFDSFGAKVDMSRQGLYNWLEDHAEFKHAKELGSTYSQLFWEKKGLHGMETRNPFNATLWIFNMKNRFKWSDRHEVVTKQPKDLSQEDLIKEAEAELAKLKEGKLEP
jgi:hypothetical protein